VPRGLEELYKIRRKLGAQFEMVFETYMVELYLDQLHDLLAPQGKAKKLELREDPSTGMIHILGVQKNRVDTVEDALAIY
jgi:hypothetical protein